MTKIDLADLDRNLIADLGEDASLYEAFEQTILDDEGYVTLNSYHIVYSAAVCNGGIVLVGSGSSGVTSWTDASSAGEVLERYLADDMRG